MQMHLHPLTLQDTRVTADADAEAGKRPDREVKGTSPFSACVCTAPAVPALVLSRQGSQLLTV